MPQCVRTSCLDAGDMGGQAVWKRILAAVDELLSGEKPEGAAVH